MSVTLPEASISGAIFEPGTPEVAELGTILPGETKTAEFRLRAQRTGSITFSQITTRRGSVGRFRLRMGVDERGVPLSPDAIGYPEFAEDLRTIAAGAVPAIERYLGQALSVSTAAQLPAGVIGVSRGALNARVVEIAEAGQRLRYGDAPERVLADLLLDFQGARSGSAGLDHDLARDGRGPRVARGVPRRARRRGGEADAVALLARARRISRVAARRGSSQRRRRRHGRRASNCLGAARGSTSSADRFRSGLLRGEVAPHRWTLARVAPDRGNAALLAADRRGAAAEVALLDLAATAAANCCAGRCRAAGRRCLRAVARRAPTPQLEVDEDCNGASEASLIAAVGDVVERRPPCSAWCRTSRCSRAGRRSRVRAPTSATTATVVGRCSRSR